MKLDVTSVLGKPWRLIPGSTLQQQEQQWHM